MKVTPKHNGTILLLALTSWDKKLEIRIPCSYAISFIWKFYKTCFVAFEKKKKKTRMDTRVFLKRNNIL